MAIAAEPVPASAHGITLKGRLLTRAMVALVILWLFLFVPAGTVRYWQGWVFLAIFGGFAVLTMTWLYRHDPKLLEHRLKGTEKRKQQKMWQIMWILIFFPAFLLASADHRFGWTAKHLGNIPLWFTVFSEACVLVGAIIIFRVMQVNHYASRTIEVEPGQTVISTGPYAFVRHPMYSGISLLALSIPVALGSFVTWPLFALLIPTLIFRLNDEERLLKVDLPGYAEYCSRTKYRLIPYLW